MMQHINLFQGAAVTAGYAITLAFSGIVVRYLIGPLSGKNQAPRQPKKDDQPRYDVGAVIGKCENIIAITLILADAVTGLALLFTAKTIVRVEDMKNNPRYYLCGTMVNFCFSLLMGFLTRLAVQVAVPPANLPLQL